MHAGARGDVIRSAVCGVTLFTDLQETVTRRDVQQCDRKQDGCLQRQMLILQSVKYFKRRPFHIVHMNY